VTSSWFFLSTLNYDARSTTHQILFYNRNTLAGAVNKAHGDLRHILANNVLKPGKCRVNIRLGHVTRPRIVTFKTGTR